MLEIRLNVSDRILKDPSRWLKLRSLLVGEEAESAPGQARLTRRRSRRADRPVTEQAQARSATGSPELPAAGPSAPSEPPRLLSNLQKAAYALQRLHEASPNPAGYTARQMALFLKEQNIDALSAAQLSWALAAMVSRRNPVGKVFARRIRRGRYLPTEHTRELFAQEG